MSQGVSKNMPIAYLEDLSLLNPKELKILLIDNVAFHSTKDIAIPYNIILLPIPPYCPELNPAEKMWQYLKSKITMKVYDTIKDLNDDRTNK